MVPTPEEFTDNSTISSGPYITAKNTSARKPLHQLTEVLDVKQKTSVSRVRATKSNHKAIIC